MRTTDYRLDTVLKDKQIESVLFSFGKRKESNATEYKRMGEVVTRY